MNPYEETGLQTLTGPDAMTFSGAEGWKYISVKVTAASTTNCTISSSYTGKIGGKDNGTIELEPGEENTLGMGLNAVDGVTITAPAGCVVKVEGVRSSPVIGG